MSSEDYILPPPPPPIPIGAALNYSVERLRPPVRNYADPDWTIDLDLI